MAESVNADELRLNLKEYQDQLQQVEQLLLDDPENEEYQGIYDGLQQVVNLTKELLATTEQQAADQGTSAAAAPPASATTAPLAAITEAPEVRVPSVLPPQVANQIRQAQQRAALLGQAPPAWAIGAAVQAVYSGDGRWYDGTVSGVSASGNFIVTFDAYNAQEEVDKDSIKERQTQKNDQSLSEYKGVAAPARRAVANDASSAPTEMPNWLEIKPTDDEKTRERKRKLIKSFKSKQRFSQMDAVQKEKADAWKSFVGKATKKKSGLKGLKKSSSALAKPSPGAAAVAAAAGGQANAKKRHEFQG